MGSIVYVTHDQIEAMTLATKIVVLKGGVVQQQHPRLTTQVRFRGGAGKEVGVFFQYPTPLFTQQ